MNLLIEGMLLSDLKKIRHVKGDIYHAMKISDQGYVGFGEAYFTTVHYGDVKGWKKHISMTLNLVVPVGKIEFVVFDDRDYSSTYMSYSSVILSIDDYKRLTVPPEVWVAFRGVGRSENLLLNIASIEHDPDEIEKCALNAIPFDWSLI